MPPQRDFTDDELRRELTTDVPDLTDDDLLRELERPAVLNSTPQDEAVLTLREQEVNEDLIGVPEIEAEVIKSESGVTVIQPKEGRMREFVDTLEAAGINARFALDPRWGTKIEAEAITATNRYLRDTTVGDVRLADVPGEEADAARKRVGDAMVLASLVRNSPLVGHTARKVHAAAFRDAVQQRLDKVFAQVQRNALGLSARKGVERPEQEEMNQIAAAAQVALQADDDVLFRAGNLAAMIDRTDPMSPTAEIRQQTPSKLIESNPVLRSMFSMVARFSTGGADARAGVGEGGDPLSSKRPEDVVNALAVVLGNQWPAILNEAKQRARINYNLGQLGLNPNTGRPGYTPDGVLFMHVAAGDALDTLTKGAAAQLALDPETGKPAPSLTDSESDEVTRIVRSDMAADEKLKGLKGAKRTRAARELLAVEAEQLARRKFMLESTGTDVLEEPLTPFEKAKQFELANDVAVGAINLVSSALPYFLDMTRGIKETDVEMNRAFEDLTGVALDKNFTYALTNSETLTDANEGLFGAWTASAALNRFRDDWFGGVERWLITTRQLAGTTEGVELGVDKVIDGVGSPEVVNQLLRDETDVVRLQTENREAALKVRDETMKRVMTWQRNEATGQKQSQSLLSHWGDVAAMTVHTAADAWYEMLRVVHEAPEEAVGAALVEMGIGNPLMVAGKKALSATTKPVRRFLATGGTGQALQRLQYSNPSAAKRFHTVLNDQIAAARKAGVDDLDALEAASAAAKRAADEADATGGIVSSDRLRDFGAKVSAVWDDLTADPGDIQNFTNHVEASVRQRTLLQEVHDIGREVFGLGPKQRVRDFYSDHPFDPKAYDQAIEAFDTIVSSGTELDDFAVNLERAARDRGLTVGDFASQHPHLVRELMPEQVNDVIAMVDQAQRIGGLHNDAANRLVEMFSRVRGARATNQLAQFRETVADVVNQIALRATDQHLQKLGWHHASKRIARATDQLRRRADNELAAARETFRRAVKDAGDDSAAVERAQLAWDGRRKDILDRSRAISDFERRVREHDPDAPFDGRDTGVLRRLSDNDIEMLVTEAPELWDLTPDDVFVHRVVGKGTRRQIDAANSRIASLERKLADADPDDVPEIRERLERARTDALRLKQGRLERTGVNREVFYNAMAHDGLGELAQVRKNGLVSVRNTLAAQRVAGVGSNPFMPAHLPLRKALLWTRQAMRGVQGFVESRTMRLQQYMDVYRRATPDEQVLMSSVMRQIKGRGLTPAQATQMLDDIIRKYPKLRGVFDDPRKAGQLRDFALEMDRNMGALYALMEEKGVDKGIINFWKEKGYNPNFYGVFERKKLVQGPLGTKLFRRQADQLTQPVATATGDSLKFQRQVNDWRVLVQEPGGGVIEESFPRNRANRKPAALQDWIRERYGKKLRFEQDVPGVEVATTPTGDTVRVGKPLHDELNIHCTVVMDPDDFFKFQQRHGDRNKSYVLVPNNKDLFGAIAGKYVHRKAIADVNAAGRVFNHVQEFLDGAQQALTEAGMVPSELAEIFGRAPGTIGTAVQALTGFMKQNLILLNERVWLGNPLFNVVTDGASGAGVYTTSEGFEALMWARRQMMGDVGRLSNQGITRLDPIREEFTQFGLGGGFFEGGGPSPSKELFASLTDFEDLPKLRDKLNERRALEAKLQRGTNNERDIARLQQDISALEVQEQRLSENVMKKFGRNLAAFVIDTGTSVTTDALGRRGGRFVHNQWNAIRGAYNAVDDMHKLAQYYTLRKFRGATPVEAAQHVRDFSQNYQMLPNILRQDNTAKQALLSLVTSFPYEATRIGFNLMHKRPTRTAAVFSVLPMLNMASLTASGIDMEQYFALMESRGAKSKTDAGLHLLNNLIIGGPGQTIASNIDLGIFNSFPNLITNDFSPIPRMMDNMFDEADSEWYMAAKIPARFLGNFLLNNPLFGGQFVMAGIDVRTGEQLFDDRMSPLQKLTTFGKKALSSVLPPWMYGSRSYNEWRDSEVDVINPRTSRPLPGTQQRGTLATRGVGLATKGRAANAIAKLVEPLHFTPIGIGPQDYEDPTPINFADSRALLIRILRKATDDDPNKGPEFSFPVNSIRNEERKWLLAKLNHDDPAIREQAAQRLEELQAEQSKLWKTANKMRDLTQREKFLKEHNILQNTPEATMARLKVDQQVDVLVQMDRVRLYTDREIANMIEQVQFSRSHSMKTPPDPERLLRATELLGEHIKSETANPRLRDLHAWMVRMQPVSEQKWKREHRKKEYRGQAR